MWHTWQMAPRPTSQTLGLRICGVLGVFACGLEACGGDDPSNWPATRPRIDEVVFVGQDPKEALGLQFMLRFVDGDGDLGGGRLTLSVDGVRQPRIQPVDELFSVQRVPAEATSGELVVGVGLNQMPEAGRQIRIGFRLEDAAGQVSNEPSVTIAAR